MGGQFPLLLKKGGDFQKEGWTCYAPVSKDQGHIVLPLAVRLSVFTNGHNLSILWDEMA